MPYSMLQAIAHLTTCPGEQGWTWAPGVTVLGLGVLIIRRSSVWGTARVRVPSTALRRHLSCFKISIIPVALTFLTMWIIAGNYREHHHHPLAKARHGRRDRLPRGIVPFKASTSSKKNSSGVLRCLDSSFSSSYSKTNIMICYD
jgi:hypothetical protein